MRDQFIFKILTRDQWRNFQDSRIFKGSPVDQADGYIHMSCAPELKATLDKWYGSQPQVALLEVKAQAVAQDLKYEVSRGGVEFPHLYADLPLTAIGQVWLVSPGEDGYALPKELKAN